MSKLSRYCNTVARLVVSSLEFSIGLVGNSWDVDLFLTFHCLNVDERILGTGSTTTRIDRVKPLDGYRDL